MKDIIDEIKEDLNQEFTSKMISKYGKYVIIFIVMVIAVSSGFVYIQNKNTKKQEYLSNAYYALQTKPALQNIPEVLLKEKSNIYLDLARLDLANDLKKKNLYKEALESLYSIITTTKHPEIKNLATIHAGFIILKNNLATESHKLLAIIDKNIDQKKPLGDLVILVYSQLLLENSNKQEALKTIEKLNSNKNASSGVKFLNNITQNSIKLD